MKITFISDTHSMLQNKEYRERLTSRLGGGPIIVHSGDMSSRGTALEILTFLEWYSSLPYDHKILVAGNHDYLFEKDPAAADDMLKAYPDITYLNDSEATVMGVRFWGSPITPYFNNWAFNRHSKEIGQHWDLIPEGIDVLVTHGPPAGILDTVKGSWDELGCPSLRGAVSRVKPKIHAFGHIHEGRGMRIVDDVLYINAAVLNGEYRPYNQEAIVVDLTQTDSNETV